MLSDSADRGIAMNRLMMICVIIYGLGIIFVDAPGRNYSPVKNLVSDTDSPTHTTGPAGTFASVCDASLMSLVFGDSMTSALSNKMSRPPAAPLPRLHRRRPCRRPRPRLHRRRLPAYVSVFFLLRPRFSLPRFSLPWFSLPRPRIRFLEKD